MRQATRRTPASNATATSALNGCSTTRWRLDADYLATGHYARVEHLPDGSARLLKGLDEAKDQSYVLSVINQEKLRKVLFPVGDYAKPKVREIAAAKGLPVASKHDSQDLCFLADNDYRRFLSQHAPAAMTPGPILTRDGRELGQHTGLPNYTIGQRKGIGVSGGTEPLYVLETDAARNALIVGTLDGTGPQQSDRRAGQLDIGDRPVRAVPRRGENPLQGAPCPSNRDSPAG